MGGSESKTHHVKHEYMFTDDEREKVTNLFCTIAHGRKSFNKDQFTHFTSTMLDPSISSRLFDKIVEPLSHHSHNKNHLSFQHSDVQLPSFASHLGKILKGDLEYRARLIVFLASSAQEPVVTTSELVHFVSSILKTYEHILSGHCTAYQSWIFSPSTNSHEILATSLLSELICKGKSASRKLSVGASDEKFSEHNVIDWLMKCTLFDLILSQVFHSTFQFYSQPMTFTPGVPQVRDTNWANSQTMLDFPTVLYLNYALPFQLQSTWKLLFNSKVHGGSFSKLLQSIRNKGSTYLIVKDKDNNVFGGFASVSWDLNPKFVGNSSCYIFQAKPQYNIYGATGYNENYMYMNYNVKTLPNGVGMGGQFDYFGFWIDQSFDSGHSKAGERGCTTYGSPQLADQAVFKVDTIEAWEVGKRKRNEDDEDEPDAGAQSILDKVSNEDRAILDMVDRGTISDAIREEPLETETADHKKILSPY